jgi:hypothetical protein
MPTPHAARHGASRGIHREERLAKNDGDDRDCTSDFMAMEAGRNEPPRRARAHPLLRKDVL